MSSVRSEDALETLAREIEDALARTKGLEARLKFDFGTDGILFIDGRSKPNRVTHEDRDADCTVKMTLTTFERIRAGEVDNATAFRRGLMTISGDMLVAVKLGPILRRAERAAGNE